jgi:protein-L-isoaspartate O-methyltransferase
MVRGSHMDRLFDVINVGAASNGLPKVLFEQLAPGGILIIPIEPIAVRKIPVRYVPLVPTGGTIKAFEC